MIDFREELNKFSPILEIDSIEVALQNDEMQDVLDMVRHLAAQGHRTTTPPPRESKK